MDRALSESAQFINQVSKSEEIVNLRRSVNSSEDRPIETEIVEDDSIHYN